MNPAKTSSRVSCCPCPLIYYLCNPTVAAGIDELLLRKKSITLDQLRATACTKDNKHNVFYVSAIVLKSFRCKSSVSEYLRYRGAHTQAPTTVRLQTMHDAQQLLEQQTTRQRTHSSTSSRTVCSQTTHNTPVTPAQHTVNGGNTLSARSADMIYRETSI